jgi:hypothetical protein
MLQTYLAAIMLTQESTNDRALLLPCGMAGNVVGDGEEHQRVQLDV